MHIVRHAPLVSIDIIVKDPEQYVLVGLRMNEPARGYFFVPGGVIRKNETIRDAFARIIMGETGCRASLSEANFVGVFEHLYNSNRFDNPEFGTHYIVLAYELQLALRPTIALDSQHNDFRWMSRAEILAATNVHHYAKVYFR